MIARNPLGRASAVVCRSLIERVSLPGEDEVMQHASPSTLLTLLQELYRYRVVLCG